MEVDAVCDGKNVFVPGIMELVERTGVHSGDSISIYPTHSISEKVKETILDYTQKLGLGIGIIGLFNIQFIVDEFENVYIIEVNPRSSRTVPFLSKATGYSLADIATLAILGKSLPEQGIHTLYPKEKERFYVKAPAFSFSKLHGMDAYLSPEMKSTGEAIGYDNKLHRAMYKAMIASGIKVQNYGTVVVTLADEDKEEALPLVRRFYDMGFNIEATVGTALFLKEQVFEPVSCASHLRAAKKYLILFAPDMSATSSVHVPSFPVSTMKMVLQFVDVPPKTILPCSPHLTPCAYCSMSWRK